MISRVLLPPKVAKAFVDIAKKQRKEPESKMLTAQHLMGSGVMSICVEQVGDLIHRMTELSDKGKFQRGIVQDKCNKSLEILQEAYGFKKEFFENLKTNANIRGIDFKDFKLEVIESLQDYALAFNRLPVYNSVQFSAREAATSLGLQFFSEAISYIKYIFNLTKNPGSYIKAVSKFKLLPNGEPQPYLFEQ